MWQGGSIWEVWWLNGWEARWLNGSVPDCCPAVPGSNPATSQPRADYQSPDGLPTGMALDQADLCEGQQRRKLRK